MAIPANDSIRILVAEDVDVIFTMIDRVLKGEGYTVIHARDGEECLNLALDAPPDLIILDLMMPKIHGLDVLKALRADERTQDVGVIICSAKNFKTEVEQAKELGTFDFLPKPFHRRDLLAIVERYFTALDSTAAADAPVATSAAESDVEVYKPQLQSPNGLFKFWGTRGSIPVSGPRFVRHGGNTTCAELNYGDERIIFDAGSGIRDLGMDLMAGPPRKLHLFITHTHWDHIQGFPFFVPAFVPNYDITIYGSPNLDKDLKSIFHGQLDRSYFPVQMEDMQATLTFKHLGDTPIEIGDLRISWAYTMHPSATVGFKIEVKGKKLAFVPDNEFLKGYVGSPHDIHQDSLESAIQKRFIDFLSDVDILIHEAQYTNEEYLSKIGWGHSSISNACALIAMAQPPHWIIPHHDPMHDDEFLQDKFNLTRQVLAELGGGDTEIQHAYDGMTLYL